MSRLTIDDACKTTEIIASVLQRANYSLAIYKTAHVGVYIKNDIVDVLSSKPLVEMPFKIITLIARQDAALSLCRITDDKGSMHTFVRLRNFIEQNKNALADTYNCSHKPSSFEKLVGDYSDKLKEITDRKDYKKIRSLRDGLLSHLKTSTQEERANIKMVENILSELGYLLNIAQDLLSYESSEEKVSLEKAMVESKEFWAQFSEKSTNP